MINTLVAFFDRENIGDVMETLHRIGVNKKAARVWFKPNDGTEIAVKTASGVTETSSVGVNLDLGIMDYFRDSNEEISYGGV